MELDQKSLQLLTSVTNPIKALKHGLEYLSIILSQHLGVWMMVHLEILPGGNEYIKIVPYGTPLSEHYFTLDEVLGRMILAKTPKDFFDRITKEGFKGWEWEKTTKYEPKSPKILLMTLQNTRLQYLNTQSFYPSAFWVALIKETDQHIKNLEQHTDEN